MPLLLHSVFFISFFLLHCFLSLSFCSVVSLFFSLISTVVIVHTATKKACQPLSIRIQMLGGANVTFCIEIIASFAVSAYDFANVIVNCLKHKIFSFVYNSHAIAITKQKTHIYVHIDIQYIPWVLFQCFVLLPPFKLFHT